jgi:hypothetical protein
MRSLLRETKGKRSERMRKNESKRGKEEGVLVHHVPDEGIVGGRSEYGAPAINSRCLTAES